MIIGVVGKPNVGKSTFFKAMTLAEVEIANYPFATIKPNQGVGYVKVDCVDKEFKVQCNPRMGYCLDGKRFVPIELIDVAGLVPGAHEGLGMGNQFLDDLNQADALIHVIDVAGTTNEKGESVEAGNYDPVEDVKFLEKELDMWYLRILEKGWEKFKRKIKAEGSNISIAIAKQLSGLRVDEDIAKEAIKELKLPADIINWTDDELYSLASLLRKKTKPMIIAANKADVSTGADNLKRLQEEFKDEIIIGCSSESELALKEAAKKEMIDYIPGEKDFTLKEGLNDNQKKALEFIKSNVLDKYGSTGVQEVMDKLIFDVLGMIVIFPGGVNNLVDKNGNVLPDCFLLKDGSTALDFAYKIHQDLGDKFIRAIDVKTKRTVGKDHKLKNRDVIEIIAGK
ncbi:MAG: redox-regulated ATPase YchF [archaeon]